MKELKDIIVSRDLDALKALLVDYPKALNDQDENGVYALHEIMRLGDMEMAMYAVEYAIVNMDVIDKKGNTILHFAVESGNLELVVYLTERVGSHVDRANYDGVTPFDKAVALKMTQIVDYFEKRLGAKASDMYHNPICRGMHADPSIVRVGDDYYMVNSSFHYFPAIPIMHSKDLIHWQVIGHAITNSEWARLDGIEGGRGYWAPDISYNEGRFYITATYRLNEGGLPQRLQMVTSSEKPEGPYCEPVFLDEEGIDPSIFTDVDGRRYMLLNRGARIFEISKDGREILSKPTLLWYGDCKKATEGPHIIYRDGYYYLFMAEGGTGKGHRIGVVRSKQLMGPYEVCPYNPILRQWDETGYIQCSGHGKPVQTKEGDWYIVYLCNRKSKSGYNTLGRETCLDPITWTADGWPLVNYLQGPSDIQIKPNIENANSDSTVVKSYFDPDNGKWGDWSTIRGYEKGSVYEENGVLSIRGNGQDLNIVGENSCLLKHQESFDFSFSYEVDASSMKGNNWDIGLTCYYDENSFIKLGLCCKNGKCGVIAAEYVDDRYVTNNFVSFDTDILKARFEIVTEDIKRTLYFTDDSGLKKMVSCFENTAYLSSEGLSKGKRFTGASYGVYVNGNGRGFFRAIHE